MSEYAPLTLGNCGRAIARGVPTGRFLGVLGDKNHVRGYHRSRNWLLQNRPDDYSIQLPDDRRGPGDAASAIDVGFAASQMRLVTRRFMDAAKRGDKRLFGLREFFGTLDGRTVIGWDLAADEETTSADRSHLWHVHWSVLRRYADSKTAADGILAVATGRDQLDMDAEEVNKAVWRRDMIDAPTQAPDRDTNPTWTPENMLQGTMNRVYDLPEWQDNVDATLKSMAAALMRIENAVNPPAPPCP